MSLDFSDFFSKIAVIEKPIPIWYKQIKPIIKGFFLFDFFQVDFRVDLALKKILYKFSSTDFWFTLMYEISVVSQQWPSAIGMNAKPGAAAF